MDVGFLSSFRHPALLVLLVVPFLLLAWTWRRRGRALTLPYDHATNRAPRSGRWIGWSVKLAESLPAVVLGVAVLLLAGPQSWSDPKSKRVMTNIEFCVDVSGSMNASFGEGTRYDASMAAINDFLDYRTGDAFGLTFFGNAILHWVPLTNDVSAFRHAPPFMTPGRIPSWFNGTEIGKALLACRRVLTQRQEGDRMIILVTDGFSADLGGGRDEEIARKLRDDGIVVNAVNVSGNSAHASIVTITTITGGEVFEPGDVQSLERVFQRIDEMQETRLERTAPEAVDDYTRLCELGLVLVGAAALAGLALRVTPW